MKLPTDKSPASLYAAWWKEVGEKQARHCMYMAPEQIVQPEVEYDMQVIARNEFCDLINKLLLWHSSQ